MRKRQIKLKVSRRNEVINIRAEVKKIKTRTIIQKSVKQRPGFSSIFKN